jgi:hypothetical protein
MKKTKPGKRDLSKRQRATEPSDPAASGEASAPDEPAYLPAFSGLSWSISSSARDVDEAVRQQPAGVAVAQLRVHFLTTRSSPLTFARTRKGARKLTVGAVLDLIEDFYQEIVPPAEAERLAQGAQNGGLFDPDEYLAEHLFPDPEGPLRMLPPDAFGNVQPSWTTERARALLRVYSNELSPSAGAGEVWQGVADLLAAYAARNEPFPLFPPRTKAPCSRLLLMGGLVCFEGLALVTGPFDGIAFKPEPGVLDVRVVLGS